MTALRRSNIVRVAVATVLLLALTAGTAYPATLRDVAISEVAWMGTTVASADEWIELYNNTGTSVDLTGWTLSASDGAPSISLNGSIPANSYYLLERTDDSSVPGVTADNIYTGALGDGGEDLILRDNSANIVDRVNSSAGWFSGHAAGRVPMVRVDTVADGSLATNWAYNSRCGTASS